MDKNIGIITMERMDSRDFNSVGSSRIRARWLLPYWDEAEEYIIGKKYDVMIFQKVYWASFKDNGNYKGVKILDICDPDWLEGKVVFEYIDWVDAVVTSTEALAEYIKKLRPNVLVRCIPDRIYLPEAVPIKDKHEVSLKKLVWFGYSHNHRYIFNTFEEIIKRGIELTVISETACDVPLTYRNRIRIKDVVYNYESINKEIIKADAVLMPEPVGTERAKYKSDNKTVQAWSLGMPVIKVPEDLDKFSTNWEREGESKRVRKLVENEYNVKKSVEEYKALIEEIKSSRG